MFPVIAIASLGDIKCDNVATKDFQKCSFCNSNFMYVSTTKKKNIYIYIYIYIKTTHFQKYFLQWKIEFTTSMKVVFL